MYSVKLRNWIICILAAIGVLALTFAAVSFFVFSNTESALADATEISSFEGFETDDNYWDDGSEDTIIIIPSGDYKFTDNLEIDDKLYIPAGENVSFDLNGHTVHYTVDNSQYAYFVIVDGSLTIFDSTETDDGTGTLSSDYSLGSAPSLFDIEDGASLLLENGNFAGNTAVYVEAGGFATINGGDFTCGDGGILYIEQGGEAVVNDGIFGGEDKNISNAITSYGTLTVNGGDFAYEYKKCVLKIDGGDAYIYGGTFGNDSNMKVLFAGNAALREEGTDTENLKYTTVTIGAEDIPDDQIVFETCGDEPCTIDLSIGCVLNIYSGTFVMHDGGFSNSVIKINTQNEVFEGSYYGYQDVYAYLNIYGGIIGNSDNPTYYGIYVDDMSVDSSVSENFSPFAYAKVSIYGGTITALKEAYDDYLASGIYIYGPADVNVYGGDITAMAYGICDVYSGSVADTSISVSGGTISATEDTSSGIYISKIGSCEISGGYISGGVGIAVAAGDITISGGTIIGSSESGMNPYDDSTGTGMGFGIVMSNDGTNPLSVTVTGDAYIDALAGIGLHNNGATSTGIDFEDPDTYNAILTISGGTIGSMDIRAEDRLLTMTSSSVKYMDDNNADPYIYVLVSGGKLYGDFVFFEEQPEEQLGVRITAGIFVTEYEMVNFDYIDLLSANTAVKVEKETKYVISEGDDPEDGDYIDFYTVTVSPCYYITLPTQGTSSYTYGDADIPETFGLELAGDHYTVTFTAGTEAGEYIVCIVADEFAYFLDDEGNILEDTSIEYTYTISQASNTVTLTLNEDGSFSYNASFGEVVLKYYSDADCTQEITEAITQSGTYYVRAEVEGTNDYEGAVSDAIAFTVTVSGGATSTDILAVVAIIILFIGLAIALAIIFGHRRNKLEAAAEAAAPATPVTTSSITADSTPTNAVKETTATPETTELAPETAESAEDNTLDEPAPVTEEPAPVQAEEIPAPTPAEPEAAESAKTEETPAPAPVQTPTQASAAPAASNPAAAPLEPAGSVTIEVPDPDAVTIPARPKK